MGSICLSTFLIQKEPSLQAFLTAMIAYFTGSNNAEEVSVMAKQATEVSSAKKLRFLHE